MLKKVISIQIVLIAAYLLSCTQIACGASGKTFFAPQPLSSMLNFLQAGIKKNPAQKTTAQPQTNPLLSYVSQDLGPFNHFAPEKNAQLLFAHNASAQKNDTSSSWYSGLPTNSNEPVFSSKATPETEKSDHTSLLTLSPQSPHSPAWIFDVTPFYIKSFSGADQRHYFFPAGKDSLTIQGSAAGAGNFDISGTWLKIVGARPGTPQEALISNAFQSNFRISPTYEYFGTNLYSHRQMHQISFGQLWGDISLPVAQVTVNHGIIESARGNVSRLEDIVTYLANTHTEDPTLLYSIDAATALSQPYRQYHKLSQRSLKMIGLGDTTLRLGITKKEFQLLGRLVLPTSKTPTNEFMFEPQLGNGSHYGLGIGGAWDHSMRIASVNGVLDVHAQLDGTYLFSNSQMRTYDITAYGPLSRFLIFRAVDGGGGQRPSYPGVNVLTKKTTVSPTGELNANLNGTLSRGDYRFGLSYALYAAPQESLSINDSFSTQYGAASALGANNAAPVNVAFVNDPTIAAHANVLAVQILPNKTISIADLDVNSATQPAKASSQFALSCGMQKKIAGDDFGINLASGLTINHTNAALSTWLIALQVTLKL